MWRRVYFLWLAVVVLPILGIGGTTAAAGSRRVCSTAPPGYARCHAVVMTSADGIIPLTASAKGYGPADFQAAYGAAPRIASRVAVVVSYDAPNILSDLATYSKNFSLPVLPTCKASEELGCFTKVSQTGSSKLPAANASWSVEASLDVEIIHAMCPGCRITLVEARTPSMLNLTAATKEAASLGATVISNSYGGSEIPSQTQYDRVYSPAGATMVVSSGDSGYGTDYPAAAPGVIAVGGTTLRMRGALVASETAWSGAGSGCSLYEAKPAWQHDKKCSRRSIADIAADADPATGAAIYDSSAAGSHGSWLTVGGTSLAAPLVAGILAASGTTPGPAALYAHPSFLRDIVVGSNGTCLSYYCQAGHGYDGPTGLGVPDHL